MSEPEDQQLQPPEPFGRLLERLIHLKKHDDGRSYTVSEVAEEIGTSKSQLYNLIKGANEPKLRLAQELATYFGVELEYFGTSERARDIQEQNALLERLSQQGVRDIAYRASALSPDVLSSVLDFIEFQASRGENHTSG
ncbi:helix-turn-helix domain-containing protein [Amycolatopsis sp. NPDC051758]|uniref:helix-turn-helix domain-containing protein n=1 Tax=Amycolatopsis sp. NPDC051758 TaxID=3363935 RepID=UPI003792804F